ncbi:hypothetical protein [Siphonobacter curvatus]|uniref:Uncharacterized protein n=1 Tax=Siphonobacter curvatus TaxID=2094562 RepID=A0A2S7IRE8_9BACT|nr:hypothetical protein [Siphonobacter curvatus]PQA60160.1 hypothetical protein C5O19_11235 [Siphonobacter curvatus]
MYLILGFIIVLALGVWLAYEVTTAPTVNENEEVIAGPGLSAVDFPESNVVFAKDQPEYRPLPGFKSPDSPHGELITCWKLTPGQRLKIVFTGKIWHLSLTFNDPLQPLYLTVNKHDVLVPIERKPQKGYFKKLWDSIRYRFYMLRYSGAVAWYIRMRETKADWFPLLKIFTAIALIALAIYLGASHPADQMKGFTKPYASR